MGWIASFFSSYLRIAVVAGFVGIAAIAGVLWWQKSAAEERANQLRIANDRLSGQVVALEHVRQSQQEAIVELETVARLLGANNDEINKILEEVRNAQDSDDGSISVLLLRALRRLDSLRRTEPAPG